MDGNSGQADVAGITGTTKASKKFPYGYQSYDFEHLRQEWPQALQRLRRDMENPKYSLDWQEFAHHFSLPDDWNWNMIEQKIASSTSPENTFNDLLRALYRAQKIETSNQATDPDET